MIPGSEAIYSGSWRSDSAVDFGLGYDRAKSNNQGVAKAFLNHQVESKSLSDLLGISEDKLDSEE